MLPNATNENLAQATVAEKPKLQLVETEQELPNRGQVRSSIEVVDPTVDKVSDLVRRIAANAVSVLIQGETGTGKEVMARTIHQLSGRTGQFVAINCAALGEALLESELFGHERGAFTGALQAKPGLFEVAVKGTIFLDEIGDLPASLQAKLLRALETRQVYRVGGVAPVKLDIRVIAATHKDLSAEVAAGGFRRDLYFRLNGITLELPPLRERRGAVQALAMGFLADGARDMGRPVPRLTVGALATLTRHDWPGNVRELRLVMERALLMSEDEIHSSHILLDRAHGAEAVDIDDGLDEKERFLRAVRAQRGNVSAIARMLNTSRSHVRRLASRHSVDLETVRGG
jgi:transcriptional regulator with PAS, ATPase and Fis domain